MIVIWGNAMYGRVDRLTNGWHVATRFFHLYYIPLIPVGSFVVISEQPGASFRLASKGGAFRGVPIGLNVRSVFLTYLRLLLGAVMCFSLIMALVGFTAGRGPQWGLAVGGSTVAIAALTLLIWTYVGKTFKLASPQREANLLKHLEAKSISGSLPAARGFDVVPAARSKPPALPASATRTLPPTQARPVVPLEPIPLDESPSPGANA